VNNIIQLVFSKIFILKQVKFNALNAFIPFTNSLKTSKS
jgi:hypothetical protein